MTKTKTTKKALLLSVFSTLVCCAMLAGSTFAWFSDDASTAETTIIAGNLDVDIVSADDDETSLEGESIFPATVGNTEFDELRWEPGMMVISDEFKIANKGSVALWYSLTVDTANTGVKNLLDVVKMKVVDTETSGLAKQPSADADQAARKAYWDSITSTGAEATTGTLKPTALTDTLVAVLYWEPSDSTSTDSAVNPDNLYNVTSGGAGGVQLLTANFTVNVFATQTPSEEDSFGKYYDASAKGGEFYAAMEEAVAAVADSLSEDSNVTITFSVNEDGNPELDVEPTVDGGDASAALDTLNKSYEAVKAAVSAALTAQSDDIESLSIGGVVPESYDSTALETAFGEYLTAALESQEGTDMIHKLANYLESNSYEITIPVTVTDKVGAVVLYNVVIDATAYKSFIQTIVG